MTYEEWIPRIEELTNLRVGNADTAAMGSLLLAPARAEIDEVEARDLLTAVSDYLLGPTGHRSAIAIRHRIDRLEPAELLPLLYAVRLISAKYGGTHRFWPPFREHLLNSVVKDHDIPNQIAPALTRAWLRLHGATAGALYLPTEGPTHIKWPVAHAGLVYTDTNDPDDPLIRYGCELKSEEPRGMHELLLAEPQDFLQDLRAWMSETPERARTHLARRVLDTSIGPTIGELAQRSLRQMYEDLPCQEMITERSVISERPSVRVVYDSIRQRLQLRIRPGSYRSRTTGQLRVGKRTLSLVGHFDALHRTQRFNEETLPVHLHEWPDGVHVDLDDLDRGFHLRPPRNPFSEQIEGALLCEADTGRQTRLWRPDTAYTLISSQECASYIQATGCLSISLVGGEEVYDFPGRFAYPAFSIRFADQKDWDKEAMQINQDLETLDAQFIIPPAGEVFSPRITAVAAINHRISGLPQFQEPSLLFKLEPPDFECPQLLLGTWVPEDMLFRSIDEVTPTRINGVQYLGLGSQVLERGRYRLSSDIIQFEFNLEEPVLPSSVGTARINLSSTDEIDERNIQVLRSPSNETTIKVLGPPEASVRLTARAQERVVRQGIDLDTEGVAFFDTSRLDLPRGTAFLSGSFLGRTSNTVTLVDGPYIAPGTWVLSTDPPEFEAWVEDLDDDIPIFIDVIGRRPWLGELVRHRHKTRFGRLVASPLVLANWDPNWLIVSGEGGLPLLIEPWPDSSNQTYFTADDFGASVSTEWRDLAARLSKTSLPIPLSRVVSATKIAEFAVDHPSIRQPEVWRPVESLESMALLAQRRIPLTAVVASSPGSGSDLTTRPAILQRESEDWLLRFGNEMAAIDIAECEDVGVFAFKRIDDAPLSACGTCDVLMPTAKASADHLGAGPGARCKSIYTSLVSAQGVVLYRGSASQLVYEVGTMLVEGMEGHTGPPPAGLTHLVNRIRESFSKKGIPQEGRLAVLQEGLGLALDVVDMFEHDDRLVDVNRINEVASLTSAAGEIAYAVLVETNILGVTA